MSAQRVKMGSVWIAGDPAVALHLDSGAQDVAWPHDRKVLMRSFLSGEALQIEQQNNASAGISFTVTKEFSTVTLCAAFIHGIMSLSGPHPWSGTAIVRRDFGDGGGYTELTAVYSILLCNAILPLGPRTVRVSYHLKCTGFSLSTYARVHALIDESDNAIIDESGNALTTHGINISA